MYFGVLVRVARWVIWRHQTKSSSVQASRCMLLLPNLMPSRTIAAVQHLIQIGLCKVVLGDLYLRRADESYKLRLKRSLPSGAAKSMVERQLHPNTDACNPRQNAGQLP